MVQVLGEPTKRDALLDLLLVSREGLVSGVSGHLGQSGHAVEFKISVDSRKSANKTSTLDVKRAYFKILREVVGEVPLGNAFSGAGLHQSWTRFKYHRLRAQEKAISKYQKSSR